MKDVLTLIFLVCYLSPTESFYWRGEESHSDQQNPEPSSYPVQSTEPPSYPEHSTKPEINSSMSQKTDYDHGYEYKNYFKYPAKCMPGYCEYEAKWSYDYKSDFVTFTISARVGRGYWAGIGFSDKKDGYSDLITGYLRKYRQYFLLDDRYVYMKAYRVDEQQDAALISHSYRNEKLMFTFKRKRNTGDKFDKSLENCVYFKFTWGGVVFPAYMPYKEINAFFSKKKICIGPTLPPDPCRKIYCKENSYCVHNGVYAKCVCRPGYYMKGDRCYKNEAPKPHFDPCKKMYCKQYQYCKTYNDRAKCVCKPQYKGKHSECMDEMMPDEHGK